MANTEAIQGTQHPGDNGQWSLQNFRARSVIDDMTGVRLVPFIASPQQMERVLNWEEDPDVRQYLYDVTVPPSRASRRHAHEYAPRSFSTANFEVVLEHGEPIGLTGLQKIIYPRQAEVHVMIGEKEHQGRGLSVAAMDLLLSYAQSEGFQKLTGTVHVENAASRSLFNLLTPYSRPGTSTDAPFPSIVFNFNLASWIPLGVIRTEEV